MRRVSCRQQVGGEGPLEKVTRPPRARGQGRTSNWKIAWITLTKTLQFTAEVITKGTETSLIGQKSQ